MDEMVHQTDQLINFTREVNRRIADSGGGHNALGRRRANAINVGQRSFDALVRRYFHSE